MRRCKRAQRQYLVYRYQYREMPAPRWDAKRYYQCDPQGSYDTLPPTVMAEPGIIKVTAKNKGQAIRLVKNPYEEAKAWPSKAWPKSPRTEEAKT